MTPLKVAAAVIAAACAAGCADPYAGEPRRQGAVPGEEPAAPVTRPAERLGELPSSPEAAVRRAAELTTTWTSADAARRYAQFADIAVGAAYVQARDAAARLPTHPQLEGTTSEGRVAAVTRTSRGRGDRAFLVVTRESLRADGLSETRWRVTLAGVERRAGGWAVSRWEPQP